jgi:phosphotriesterase-related protein
VSPSAFIWTHASGEKDLSFFNKAATEGAWVSLDGLNEDNVDQYVKMLSLMKESQTLNRALVSHDAGWYSPGQPDGGKPRGYTTLFKKLVPALKQAGFADADIEQILTTNPWEAHAVRVRRV